MEEGSASKKRKLADADFKKLLLECGVSSMTGECDELRLHDHENDNNDGRRPKNNRDTISTNSASASAKTGCILDENVTPSILRSSIHGLLSEMHRNGSDVDNEMILDSMERLIMTGVSGGDDDDGSGDGDEREDKYRLLWKMLLPMTLTIGEDEIGLSQSQTQTEGDAAMGTKRNKNSTDSSLIKILLRVDTLQSRLLTILLQKLQEIATEDEEGDGEDEGMEESLPLLNAKSIIHKMDAFAYKDEIPRLIMSHIRWLELIVEPATLVNAALECISVLCTTLTHDDEENDGDNGGGGASGPAARSKSILLDLIATLPDIMDDGCIAEDPDLLDTTISQLRDVRVSDPTLLIPCLDAVSSLRFTSDEQIETILMDALEALESVTESWLLPPLCKFLVQNVSRGNQELCAKVIESFRRLRLGLDDDDNYDDDDNNGTSEEERDSRTSRLQGRNRGQVHHKTDAEALMLEALVQGFTYRRDLTNALLEAIKCTAPSQHGAADLWLLFCSGVAAHNKIKVNPLIKAKVMSGGFSAALLVDAVRGNGAALHHLFDTSMLPLADTLVRSNEKAVQDFGGCLYKEMFLEFLDRMQRQEIVGQLIIHIASGSLEEIDVAMKVFSSIAASGGKNRGRGNELEGTQSLRIFLPFLMSLIENVQNFSPTHLRTLFLLLFIVGGSEDMINGGGIDDVHIVIRKYLALPQIKLKRIGIIGAVCFASCVADESATVTREVIGILELALKSCVVTPLRNTSHNWRGNCNDIDDVSSAQSIFFDELCLAMRATALSPSIKGWILDRFSTSLEDSYFGDLGNSEDCPGLPPGEFLIKEKIDKTLVDGTTKNTRAPRGELRFNIDKDDAVVYIKLLSLHVSDDLNKRYILPQDLCPLLRLVSTAYDERFGGDGISNIDALLGCPLLLPDEDSSGIEFIHLSDEKQITTVSSLFSAVCWCREVINSFIFVVAFPPSPGASSGDETQFTQEQNLMRGKIVEKLHCLLELEEELMLCATKCHKWAPPGLQPISIPKEVRDMKQGEEIDEAEDTSMDGYNQANMTAEEKKAFNEIKKAAKKKASEKMKSKHKALKIQSKFEEQLEARARSVLRPLSSYACLALGFSELRVRDANMGSSQEMMLSFGASELKNLKVGDKPSNYLLDLFERSLTSLFGKTRFPFNGKDIGENPYSICSNEESSKSVQKAGFEFLSLCIDANVFVSIHERFVAVAEIMGDEDTGQNNDIKDTLECMRLLLRCLKAILGADELHSTAIGRGHLEAIVKQIADGEEISAKSIKPLVSYSSYMRSLVTLFDLIEEAIIGGCETNDLDFTMIGVSTVSEVVRQATMANSLDVGKNGQTGKTVRSLRTKASKLCLNLLRREWGDSANLNKNNVGKLIALHLEHYSTGSHDLSGDQFLAKKWGRIEAIQTLTDEALLKIPMTNACKGPVNGFHTCCKSTFGSYFSSVLSALPKEMSLLFQNSMKSCDSKAARNCLVVLECLISIMNCSFDLTKENPALAKSPYLLMQLKSGYKFIDVILKRAIPFCVKHFQGNENQIIQIVESIQSITKQLSFIISHGKRTKDATLVKESPKVRKACEEFLHKTKAMLQKNDVIGAFWGGNLHNRNIDGSRVVDKSETEEDDDDGSETEDEKSGESSATESEDEAS